MMTKSPVASCHAAPHGRPFSLVGLLVEDPDLVLLVGGPVTPARLGQLGLEPPEVVRASRPWSSRRR